MKRIAPQVRCRSAFTASSAKMPVLLDRHHGGALSGQEFSNGFEHARCASPGGGTAAGALGRPRTRSPVYAGSGSSQAPVQHVEVRANRRLKSCSRRELRDALVHLCQSPCRSRLVSVLALSYKHVVWCLWLTWRIVIVPAQALPTVRRRAIRRPKSSYESCARASAATR
jgi:hypothetical protein